MRWREIFKISEQCSDIIIGTEYENWPDSMKNKAMFTPVEKYSISPDLLLSILSQNSDFRNYLGLNVALPLETGMEVSINDYVGLIFPKIGPVSYKEYPLLFPIEHDKIKESMSLLFSSISARMAAILVAYVETKIPPNLYFFPYKNVNNISELRLEIIKGKLYNAKWLNYNILSNNNRIKQSIIIYSNKIINENNINTMLLDLYVVYNEEKYDFYISEINPFTELMQDLDFDASQIRLFSN